MLHCRMSQVSSKNSYHHGDLRRRLLEAATEMIGENGIDGLSLRKLAERVGVSRTAPYHHFKDKNELLCAIAEQGFVERLQGSVQNFEDESISMRQRFRQYVHGYMSFALENPELYELMFGRTIWKAQSGTDALKASAYPTFQYQVDMVRHWQSEGLLKQGENPLRLSQVIWGTLHGITKLLIDGIYTEVSQVEEIFECAVSLFLVSEDN